MHVDRVVYRQLKALRHRDDDLMVVDHAMADVCIRGLNGSGKTTWLDGIAELFRWLRRCSKRRRIVPAVKSSVLHHAGLAAIRVSGLPLTSAPTLWLIYGDPATVRAFVAELTDGTPCVSLHHPAPLEVLDEWDLLAARAEFGGPALDGQPLPNMVRLDAIGRYSRRPEPRELLDPTPLPVWLPVADHNPQSSGAGHVDGMLRTLYLARPERWRALSAAVALLRPTLRLSDRFDESTLRPLFRLDDGTWITSSDLSAGEQAVLVTLTTILRWLAPGGVVLLDEPELHQHAALIRGHMQFLSQVVTRDLGGQLFVASHAPDVWEHYASSGHIVDLDRG